MEDGSAFVAELVEVTIDIERCSCHSWYARVVGVIIDERPKCTYGCMDVGVLNRRGAMEINFYLRVEDGPTSEGVLPIQFKRLTPIFIDSP